MEPHRAWIAPALAIVGGVALLVATFLTWYSGVNVEGAYFNRATGAPAYAGVFSAWGDGQSAWQAFAGLDVALAACAAASVVAGVSALRPRPRLTRPACLVAAIAAVGAGAWTLERVFDRPGLTGLGPGAVIGFAALVLALTGVALTLVATGASGAKAEESRAATPLSDGLQP
ncbi:MAG: hypothetical protein QOH38_1871 [Thermoleophilaceae bacterium]|nr:hypothetical protein [Thermoleophilaceae bacterium]